MLTLCHSVIADDSKKKNEIIYNASSPDELALLNFAKFCGYNFNGIDDSNNYEISIQGVK